MKKQWKTSRSGLHFESAAAFRSWLESNHASATELWVGFHTKASGKGGATYPEALDEALCFGWIDGIRRKVDADSYTSRFTPRKARSTWSLVNVRHVERLTAAGRMHPAGIRSFEARDPKRTGIYSFEQRPKELPTDLEKAFRANPGAWTHWQGQPSGYRRTATWWVVSAVREETRQKRLQTLIAASGAGRRVDLLV
jgi:uncharacterized protein YdeI (YjbR/CyaY-like superfamily)